MTTPVTFRCKQSGHTVTFTAPVDINSMKGHDGYEEVQQGQQQEAPTKEVLTSKKSKKTTESSSEE